MALSFTNFKNRLSNLLVAAIFISAQAGAALAPFVFTSTATALDTSFQSPAADDGNHSDWSNASNAYSSNNIYATETSEAQDQSFENFGFSIPAGSTIDGLQVTVEGMSTDISGCQLETRMWSTSDNEHTDYVAQPLSGTDTVYNIGSSSSLWGSTWTADDFSNANFHAEVRFDDVSGNTCTSSTVSLDHIQVKVFYTEAVVVLPPDYGCTDDTAGPNDEPGQKDLTQLCKDANSPDGEENVTWNWDDLGTSGGGQSLDACGLFDSDGDANANYSVCLTTSGDPAEFATLTIYSCSDAKNDRCTNPSAIGGSYETTCTVDQLGTDPFPTGGFSPQDTVASCNFILADLNAGNVELNLTDVCSYPSKQPNSDPSDCVIIQTNPVASIELIKDIVPNGNGGLFNLTVDGPLSDDTTTVNDRGDGGSTGQVIVSPPNGGGTATVSETAGTGTSLDYYVSSIKCVNRGNGQEVASGSGTSLQVPVSDGSDIVCTITNTLRQGTLTVNKVTDPANDPAEFSITASGTGAIEGNATQTLSTSKHVVYTVNYGTYSVDEADAAGWQESANTCSDVGVGPNNPNPSCTITNTKLATINILKNALPNHDQDFSFLTTTLPGGNFLLDDDSGAADENNTLNSQKSFSDLTPNVAYSVTENSLPGWELTGLTCDTGNFTTLGSVLSVTPTAGQTINCTFTNTKYGIISGYKYEVNADGSSLGGLMNWTINLLLGGNAYATTTTDASGFYFFDSLLPDDYNVQEVNQAGYTQIYPNPNSIDVTLDAGEVSTDNNFGNFENGSIGGFKWNDLNGNGDYDNEPKLDEWTITLFNDGSDDDSDLDDVVSSDVTDSNGAYSFGNLAPGNYAVCETNKSGWVQTYPLDPNCHLITVDESGETNSEVNFGNQGRGTITVVKNVDTNNDGQVDQSNVTNWTWDIDGVGNFATGNTNTQQVAAGTYSVSEDQKTNFHFVSVDCGSDERIVQGESVDVTVSPGENVVCTFTNARDRGDITVLKNVDMNNDGVVSKEDGDIVGATDWTWDIDGDEFDEENIAMGSTRTVPTGNYTIKEDQKDNYEFVSVECSNDQEETVLLLNEFQLSALLDVNQAETIELQINRDDSITCTYTNRKLPTQLNLEKSNNRPNPTNTGDVVTYTLVVSVPEDHSALYDTVVQDLPPENFEYVDGSWTAYSSERGDIKNSPTTEPAYASPGQWNLGTMLAGEVVTLTYRAVISSIVSAGTYPDLAFAQGCGVNGATCDDAEIVYSNSNVTSDPFVGTQVTILAEDVVPATKTVLVNTGENHTALYAAIASILMLGAIIVARFQLPTKGGRK